ncbi:MAG: tryptophan transporter [Clostridia bacterium]|nr:tryptophan transporter [Clostridia bacterium]
MKIKEMAQISLLLAIGFILHLITPGYGAGMKPDLLIAMLFVIILLKRDFKASLLAGGVAGIIAALTTTFPAGQIPNLIDKLTTSLVVFLLVKLLADRMPNIVTAGIIGALGTLVSGTVFLLSALALVGIPAPFEVLFVTVVIPAAVANTIGLIVLYPLVVFSKKVVDGSRPQQVTK